MNILDRVLEAFFALSIGMAVALLAGNAAITGARLFGHKSLSQRLAVHFAHWTWPLRLGGRAPDC